MKLIDKTYADLLYAVKNNYWYIPDVHGRPSRVGHSGGRRGGGWQAVAVLHIYGHTRRWTSATTRTKLWIAVDVTSDEEIATAKIGYLLLMVWWHTVMEKNYILKCHTLSSTYRMN